MIVREGLIRPVDRKCLVPGCSGTIAEFTDDGDSFRRSRTFAWCPICGRQDPAEQFSDNLFAQAPDLVQVDLPAEPLDVIGQCQCGGDIVTVPSDLTVAIDGIPTTCNVFYSFCRRCDQAGQTENRLGATTPEAVGAGAPEPSETVLAFSIIAEDGPGCKADPS